jgi:hypothetical protein
MRCVFAIVALLLLSVTAVDAQVQTGAVRKLSIGSAPVPLGDCAVPALPSTIASTLYVQPEDRIAWCVDDTTANAQASSFTLYVDDVAFPLMHVCLSGTNPPGVQCLAQLPIAAVTVLRQLQQHRIEMTRTANGLESARSPYLTLITPGCKQVNLDVAPPVAMETTVPIGSELGKRTLYSTVNATHALGLLRANGWRVDWWRTQYAAPSTATASDGGHWYFLAWCVGIPQ